MEIKKRLITGGASDVNAVLLNDEGEEYPVFLESLHNNIIFPTLIESGYKLTSLPYGFIKGSMKFNDLPVEKYQVTPKEEEMMYNSIGVKLEMDEIKKHIIAEQAEGIKMPPANYTIFTREDFLHYLDSVAKTNTDLDFMPINYFVAPEARFSFKEYLEDNYSKYIMIMANRRLMSVDKIGNLINKLQELSVLPANFNEQDLLDAYFAWGLDGLNTTILNKRRESRPYQLHAANDFANSVKPAVILTQPGFMDGIGNMYKPASIIAGNYKPLQSENDLIEIRRTLKPDDSVLIDYASHGLEEVTILECVEREIYYSVSGLIFRGISSHYRTFRSLEAKPVLSKGIAMDIKYALPANKQEYMELGLIESLARKLYSKRIVRTKVSSFKALQTAGLNPESAIYYICDKLGIKREFEVGARPKASMKDMDPSVMDILLLDSDVENYLNGETKDLSEDQLGFLDSVVQGTINIDNIGNAETVLAMDNVSKLVNELKALHYTMGISFEELYQKINSVNESVNSITFSNGQYNYTIDTRPITAMIDGYNRDINMYSRDAEKNASFFYYITLVAREVGDQRAQHHVGFEGLFVNRNKAGVAELINELMAEFDNRLEYSTLDPAVKERYKEMRWSFAYNRYFEAVLKGTITWPKGMGSTEPVMPSKIEQYRKYVEVRIDSNLTICYFGIAGANAHFAAHCVNAYVTPEYVIPRKGFTIHEVPFFTAWFDYNYENPEIYARLVSAGIIKPNFVAWSRRYAQQQFKQRDVLELDSLDSLYYYAKRSVADLDTYPDDIDFVSVVSPIMYNYPGLYLDGTSDDELIDVLTANLDRLPVPRETKPVARLSLARDITRDDYIEKINPTEKREEPDSYIRAFQGFEPEVYLNIDDPIAKIPKQTGNFITVSSLTGKFLLDGSSTLQPFREIVNVDQTKYPVAHIFDRMYIIRDYRDELWEVRV